MKLNTLKKVQISMTMTPLRVAVLACAACTLFSISAVPASAGVVVGIQVGAAPPPPPPPAYQRWPQPSRNAVWISGHHEWVGGRWVWVGGYYGYPPHRGAVYVPSRYYHGRYYAGYWR